MNRRDEREAVEHVEKLTINSYDEIGVGKSIGTQLPKEVETTFTNSKISIPSQNIDIPFTSIRDFNVFDLWEGEKHQSALIRLHKYKATRTKYWRLILQDRTYFTFSKKNSNIERVMRAGAVDVSVPKINTKVAEKITSATQNEENQRCTHVPVEYIDTDGVLRVEGWKNGASEINAGVDASATTGGVSLGYDAGPVSIGGSASKSTISGDIEGEISDNTYSTPIKSFLIFEDKIIIDSELRLELFHEEIDRIIATDEGFIIEVGQTTYRTKVRRCRDELGDIAKYIQNQMKRFDDSSAESPQSIPNKLIQLKNLNEGGIISDDDFESKKKDLLDDF